MGIEVREEARMTPRKWAIGVLAGASALLVYWSPAPAQLPQAPKPAAVVDGEAILMSEVEGVMKLMPPPSATPTDIQRRQMQREALEMLMDDVIMRHFLNKNGRRVEPAEVEKNLRQLEAGLKKQNRSLQEFLSDTSQTESHLRLDILKKLQWEDYANQYLTENNLKRYYNENKDFYDQVKVRASHILIRVGPTASAADHQAARSRLADLRQRIVANQLDFADAARTNSQCASAANGGDIGYFQRKFEVDEIVARTAFSLKVGQISEVVQSDYGYHLIKATDRKEPIPSTLEKVKDAVRDNFAMELWQATLTQQRKQAHVDINVP
jgi:peptidyl-prolyl cis-trans isomerase C